MANIVYHSPTNADVHKENVIVLKYLYMYACDNHMTCKVTYGEREQKKTEVL